MRQIAAADAFDVESVASRIMLSSIAVSSSFEIAVDTFGIAAGDSSRT